MYSHKKSLKKSLPFNPPKEDKPPLPPNEDKPPPPITTHPDVINSFKGKYRNPARNTRGSILPAIVLEEEDDEKEYMEDKDDIADMFIKLTLGDSKPPSILPSNKKQMSQFILAEPILPELRKEEKEEKEEEVVVNTDNSITITTIQPNLITRCIKKIIFGLTRLPVVAIFKTSGIIFIKLIYYILKAFTTIYNIPIIGKPICLIIIIYLFTNKFTRPLMYFLIEVFTYLYNLGPDIGLNAAINFVLDFAHNIGVMYLVKSLSYFYGVVDTLIEKMFVNALTTITSGFNSILSKLMSISGLQQQTIELLQEQTEIIKETSIQQREYIADQVTLRLKNSLLEALMSDQYLAILAAPAMAGITNMNSNMNEQLSKLALQFKADIQNAADRLLHQQSIRESVEMNKLELIQDKLSEILLENLATHHVTTNSYQLMIENGERQLMQQDYIKRILSNVEDTKSVLNVITLNTERNLQMSQIQLDRIEFLQQIVMRIENEQRITDDQLQHCVQLLSEIKGELLYIDKDNPLHKIILKTLKLIATYPMNPIQRFNHRAIGYGGKRTRHRNRKQNIITSLLKSFRNKKILRHKKSLRHKKILRHKKSKRNNK